MTTYEIIEKMFSQNIFLNDFSIQYNSNIPAFKIKYKNFVDVFYSSNKYDCLIFDDELYNTFINFIEYKKHLRRNQIYKLLNDE